jgi:DNA repair and recombination protein RAD54B
LREVLCYGASQLYWVITFRRSVRHTRIRTVEQNLPPPVVEYVVFVSPTRLQLAMLSNILSKDAVNKLAHSSTAKSLAAIGSLMKLCNSPMLLLKNEQSSSGVAKPGDSENDLNSDAISRAITCIPKEARFADVSLSGKLIVLANILRTLRKVRVYLLVDNEGKGVDNFPDN